MSEALRKAALAGDAAAVKSLLSSGVEQLSHDGGESVTKLPPMLLQESDDAELGRYGYKLCRTALALASLHGHHEVVAMLQAHEEKDATGKTPLHLACQAGHLTVVRLLLERGCKAASRAPGKATLLHLAAGYGHSKLLAWMLEAKLFKNVDLKDSQGESALHLACSEADLDCMKLLLNNGADPNLADRSKQLPLQKFVGALRWVEEKPDGPTFSTHWGDLGQRFLVGYPEERLLPGIELLLTAGGKPTGLLQAAGQASTGVVRRLLQAGASTREQDVMGNSPLDIAKLYNRAEIIALLEGEPRPPAAGPEETPSEQERWGPELKPPEFGSIPPEAVKRLGEVCRSPVGSCSDLVGAWAGRVEREQIEFDLIALHEEFLEQGCYLFLEPKTDRLMLLPTTERADVIAAVGTNGVNCGIGPGYIVEWLETLHRAAPFVLTIVGSDILAGRFCSDIPETAHWARRMYAFCPDIVDQGTGTVESLADGLKESRELFFWWD